MAQFWKPGTVKPRMLDDEEGGVLFYSASPSSSSTYGHASLEKQRQRLPVFKYRTSILYLVETHSTTIIVGETGSGKTTQIPQSVAARLAEEMGVNLGEEVGYTIRFEDVTNSGRGFNVQIFYAEEPVSDYLRATVSTVMSIHNKDLVFSPSPRGKRKVVISTNIAETSLTLEITDIENLVVAPISKASARQRAGRAGRGIPEMQRSNLVSSVIQLKALGIDNILGFDWPSSPSPEAMVRALEVLYSLGILDDDAKLTSPVGFQVAELPLDPMISKMIIVSDELGCSEEIITVSAILSVQSIWISVKGQRELDEAKLRFAASEGDHVTFLNVYRGFLQSNKSSKWCHKNFINYHAMPYSHNGTYKTLRSSQEVYIHPSSVLFRVNPKWVVYHSLVSTDRQYMRNVISIDPSWLREAAPHFYQQQPMNPTHH
ncbi:protein of unknown function DUF1605 [Cynara cardunculus var. scolymus]|uniref:RNA helicase n=1 Tax=Cynara cardunculus var. scolymus TaxID=59895 RepID=A0A118JT25_CYNCS|nr:protein of unknown function DUF1605 [Cynara cardunculus var. scolymus]